DRGNPEYKAPYNQLFNIPRVYTPEDKAIQTPNSDTPYSWIGLDLRAEPIVFTVPPIEKDFDADMHSLKLNWGTYIMLQLLSHVILSPSTGLRANSAKNLSERLFVSLRVTTPACQSFGLI